MLEHGNRRAIEKPGQQILLDTVLEVSQAERFVSRGGYKLLSALDSFQLDVTGMVALDAGASTGGFTDCLLQCGAVRVYAVDVGHGQLHWKLQRDPRVINMERRNLRHAPLDLLPEKVDVVVMDCSFISLSLLLPPVLVFLKDQGQILALVKPQFELGAKHIHKGIVRSEALQRQAVEKIQTFAEQELGLSTLGVAPAGIKGPKGNQEYFIHITR